METTQQKQITVEATVNAPVSKVWNYFTEPAHIMKWCYASDDWHAPYAENDVRDGGKFKTTMAAKDGSMQFDFAGIYDKVEDQRLITYRLEDGRQVRIEFSFAKEGTIIRETFDPENVFSVDMQRAGWQSILDNFKKYVEAN
ncbi:MAG TPA: SRPBCC family protein [Chryseosolibacter sp.]|nr:SRPBCC family protein [Chryseosolibacter sp.]